MFRSVPLLALPMLLAATAAQANFFNGRDLDALCRNDAPDCRAYIAGVVDSMETKAYWEGRRGADMLRRKLGPFEHCWPGRAAPVEAAVEVVRRYLADHPAEHRHPAPEIIAKALSETYACPQGA
jgi:hypothetical protein